MSEPTAQEWALAAWRVQSWIKSCYDQVGACALCGAPEAFPPAHVNDCPWPQTRELLNRTTVRP